MAWKVIFQKAINIGVCKRFKSKLQLNLGLVGVYVITRDEICIYMYVWVINIYVM